MDNLPQLRDIHLPNESIAFFPLAKGWWICLFLAVATVVLVKLFIAAKKASAKFYAKHLLLRQSGVDDLHDVAEMSEVFRRICVKKYPEAVALYGKDWISFIRKKTKQSLPDDLYELLNNAPYIGPKGFCHSKEDVAKLRKFCLHWIGENL